MEKYEAHFAVSVLVVLFLILDPNSTCFVWSDSFAWEKYSDICLSVWCFEVWFHNVKILMRIIWVKVDNILIIIFQFSINNVLSTLPRWDNDNDGVVSVKEVSQVCRTIGFNPPEAELQVGQTKYFGNIYKQLMIVWDVTA